MALNAYGLGSEGGRGSIQAGIGVHRYSAFARKRGGQIGPRRTFHSRVGLAGEASNFSGTVTHQYGYWVDVKERYLGLKFKIGKQIHYGWARLNVHFGVNQHVVVRATLTGYAYETEPDKPIVAGDEGTGAKSLVDLALGAGRQ